MATNLSQKNPSKFECKNCNYFTCSFKDYNKHILTQKHTRNTLATFSNTEPPQKTFYVCKKCNKEYYNRTGLWRHQKKCKEVFIANSDKVHENEKDLTDKDLIMILINQNKELMEIFKNGTNNNTTINSHNKAFNLNFFLNETCKDAMNIMDFVESIKLQVSDLESVGELGYIEGISNIIVKNLNALDVTKRPVHCTDKKRETIYIKDDDKWEKDEEQKKMHKMIKKVADKNARLLPKFTEKYPDYKNYHSKTSDKYSKIIIEAMGGSGDNDYEKEEKIIKKIAKNILVEK
jgi:hypothetical protein